ncbi:SUKH-4 family immunity protein [Streptomyces celluloflavus]|uniref:SUKH-4 family immunity protein n=1 Tax=Streptomyces celluloflavus TaxID=58344 RepID=UPI0036971847
MASNTPALERVPSGEAADRVVQWWQDGADPLAPKGWLSLVDERSADGGRVSTDGGQVLRAVHERVESSILLDATGLTAEELLRNVLAALAVDSSRYGGTRWISELRKQPARRLVLIGHLHRMGRTRRSCEARRMWGGTLKALCNRKGLHVVAHVDTAAGLLDSRDAGIRLDGPAEPTDSRNRASHSEISHPEIPHSEISPSEAPWPDELRALALAEPRQVPLRVWAALAEGWGLNSVTEAALDRLVDDHPQWLNRASGGVAFADEGLAETLRQEASAETVTRVNRHMTTWLRSLSDEIRHPGGWAAGGPLGTYAAMGLAMHAARAEHDQKWTATTFDALVSDATLVAHIPQTSLMDAAHCAHNGVVGENNAAADAMYLWDYGVVPPAQGEWAAWLHLMATARGDTVFASGLPASGIRMPWQARWTRWRPPGGYHPAFLEPGAIGELVEVRWQGRPAVAGIGTPELTVGVWDARTGEPLAGTRQEREDLSEELRTGLSWPQPAEPADRHDPNQPPSQQPQPQPQRITTIAELQDRVPDTDSAHPSLLGCAMLRIGDLLFLGGSGGLFALHPADAFDGAKPPQRAPLSGAYAAPGPTTPVDASPPGPADLRTVVGADAFRTFAPERLPAGLHDDGTRRVLAEPGLPELNESGLRIAPDWDGFLSAFEWPEEADEPESEGPFFRLGLWMGGTLVLDGTTGHVLRVPREADDPVDGLLVASGLENFLTMVAQWLTGLRIRETVEGRDEEYLLRQHISGALWLIDETGAESEAWSYLLDNE